MANTIAVKVARVVGIELLSEGAKVLGSRLVLDFEPGSEKRARNDSVIGFPLTAEQGEQVRVGQNLSFVIESAE
jgi:hypothetical protein